MQRQNGVSAAAIGTIERKEKLTMIYTPKIFPVIAAGILALSSLTACSEKTVMQSDIASQAFGEEALSAEQENGRQIHQISNEGGTNQDVSSENGYYELLPVFPNSYSIFYTDYATNRQIYLCDAPGCDHAGEYCTSYVDASQGNVPGFLYSDSKLYVVSPASVNDSFLPRIEVMNPDGSDRTLLAEFKASQNLNTGFFLADEENLYFIIEDFGSDGDVSRAVYALNKQTGEQKTLREVESDTWILDGNGSYIYIKTIQGKSLHKVSAVNVEDPEQETEVDSWNQKERMGGMLDGKMYYYDVSKDSFAEKNYKTGEIEEISNTTGVKFKNIYLTNIFDDKVFFTATTDRDDEDPKCYSSFYADFAAGQLSEIGVTYQDSDRPVNIRALYQDQIYALFDVENKSISFELDGQMQTSTISVTRLGHMPLQDYLKGESAFVACETVE